MTTDTEKLVEMARGAGFKINHEPQWAHLRGEPTPAQLAAFRDRIIASLCGDVEPVGMFIAGSHKENGRVSYARVSVEYENDPDVVPLYSASTVAALKARVAVLERALQGLVDFHTKPAGVTVELIAEKDLFSQAMADIDAREKKLVEAAIAALTKGQP